MVLNVEVKGLRYIKSIKFEKKKTTFVPKGFAKTKKITRIVIHVGVPLSRVRADV